MDVLFFCTRWGQEHIPWNTFLKKVKDAGYDGVETNLPLEEREADIIANNLAKYDLKLIGQHWDTVVSDFNAHLAEYEKRLKLMTVVKPLFITSHTGKDYYTFDQNVQLLTLAHHISLSSGIPIIHETHRGKFSFAVHLTKSYLENLPWLKLTLDISHWFTVAESYLLDQAEALDWALLKTNHIHARVGYTQGPQIIDLQAPEWQEALQVHLQCWDKVIALRKKEGARQFTFTSEFGPFPYMVLEGTAKKPADKQWDMNNYMKNLLKKRYKP